MGEEEEERLRSLISKLHAELAVLDRVVYKNKNQHRRSRYFHYLLKVRRDLKLLQAAKLPQILNALFPIIGGKRPAERAMLSSRAKKQSTGANYSFHERLLGVARLLSEMPEPVIKAAIQISLLLAKSFFVGFSTMVLALLGRIRIIVQQMLLDVVVVFNKISEISQSKQSVKLIEDGIEAFREYNPVKNEVVILECQWQQDKFVLLEKLQKKNNSEDEVAISGESTIKYSTILLFDEDKLMEAKAEPTGASSLNNGSSGEVNCMNREDNVQEANPTILRRQEDKSVAFVSVAQPKNLLSGEVNCMNREDNVQEANPTILRRQEDKSVAFVSVAQPKNLLSDPSLVGSNKKPKLDAGGTGLPQNLFDDLEFSETRESSIF